MTNQNLKISGIRIRSKIAFSKIKKLHEEPAEEIKLTRNIKENFVNLQKAIRIGLIKI